MNSRTTHVLLSTEQKNIQWTATVKRHNHHLTIPPKYIQIISMIIINSAFNQKARQQPKEAYTWHIYQTDYSKPGSIGLSA